MSMLMLGLSAVIALLVVLTAGVPIAWATAVVGVAGEIYVTGFHQTASQVSLIVWETGTQFVFVALPLFLLMGQITFRTGITSDLYECVHQWVGRMPGGLAVAAVLSNAMYGAVTGNSVASIATMGPIVMPEFRKYKYDLGLGAGTLASAGTLAVLVPPSTILVIYGVWTETSISKLFLAGIVPCLLLTGVYGLTLMTMCWRRPALGPRGPRYSWGERLRSLSKLLPVAVIMGIVLGGIYTGIMTPSESGAVGVVGVLVVAAFKRRLTWPAVRDSLYETIHTAGMVFAIVVTGILFTRFLVHTNLTSSAASLISSYHLPNAGLLLAMFGLYLLLGVALETFGILILSLPFVMPIVAAAGIDKIWFGVFVALMVELAAIHPPLGIAVAVMRNVAPDVSTMKIFRGCCPFIGLTLALGLLLIAFPEIALWLPRHIK